MHTLPHYAELRCLSNFSFLRGASWPEELVERAHQLGYAALALTDECSVAGVVRAHTTAQALGLKLLVGSQFQVEAEAVDGAAAPGRATTTAPATPPAFVLTVLACHRHGYGRLCEFITSLRRASPKGSYHVRLEHISGPLLEDCVLIASPQRMAEPAALQALAQWLLAQFGGRCWLGVEQLHTVDDEAWLERLQAVGTHTGIPLVALGDVHCHVRSRKPLQDVLTAIRIGQPLTECGLALLPNAEQHLRSRMRLGQLFAPELLAQTLAVAERCHFSLNELRYQYPAEVVPAGQTPAHYLRYLTQEGAQRRWPQGVAPKVQTLIDHELGLITELHYEHYFLTVYDIVAFARSRNILCQGRGSAANSAVCYCLGITEVDPARQAVLFERFISRERNEPPDIDVDFEHERREEVIQYLYAKYGRERAALAAVVISYRSKSVIKDVGKALGFAPDVLDALSQDQRWREESAVRLDRLTELGLPADDLAITQLRELCAQLLGFPRHLSQHPGGFVLTQGPLCQMVPIENANMPERTVVQWDKDDLDALGLLKVDVLGLGMLSALRRALDFIGQQRGQPFALQDIPAEDPATYAMISQADTVGVFQIESRAQMSMLPRLKPQCFYDLVIEVAIVRPGPISGGMVHPYLNRRQGKVPVTYPSPALQEALQRTLGVPIFQEQVMQIAILAAGFSPGEADGLRRAMAAWKRKGGLEPYQQRLINGMTERGYSLEFAQSIYEQIKGFGEYGFPESHAASFALLVYASCWIKRHHPAEFLAALLNAQPLGFYSPSQLVQDAKRHGIEVRPVDVLHSHVDCTLEVANLSEIAPATPAPHPAAAPSTRPPAVRLGLRLLSGLPRASAERIVATRLAGQWGLRVDATTTAATATDISTETSTDTAATLARAAALAPHELTLLASADALQSLSGHRREQLWAATAWQAPTALLRDAPLPEDPLAFAPAPEGEEILWDYAATGLTLRRHPLALLRTRLGGMGLLSSEQLRGVPNGRRVGACGIVTVRQQPETAKGTLFISLEDEAGSVQVIVWKRERQALRAPLLRARLLAVRGTWQREGEVCNLIASHAEDLTHLLGRLATESRDFR